jgi:GT2 family glycosyltransferase
VEQSAEPEIADRLPSWVRYCFCPSQPKDALFNRSLAFNVGARSARGRLLVLHDNDMLVPTCYAKELVARWDGRARVINLKRYIFYLNELDSKEIMASHRMKPGIAPDQVLQNLTGGGSLAVDSSWYFEVGGHDEEFVGWGGEDVEFWDRATSEGGVDGYAMLPIVHLWHKPQPDKSEKKDSNAMRRLERLSQVPAARRIEQLKAKQRRPAGEAK